MNRVIIDHYRGPGNLCSLIEIFPSFIWEGNNLISNNSKYIAKYKPREVYETRINGQLEIRGKYKGGYRHGIWEEYYYDMKPKLRGRYQNEAKTGLFEEWWKNGKLESSGRYLNNEKDGIWEKWDEKGKLKSVKKYSKGVRIE